MVPKFTYTSLARVQQARSYEVAIAAPSEQSRTYFYDGLPVHRFGIAAKIGLRGLYGEGDPTAATNFQAVLDQFRPDVLHLHAFTSAVSATLAQSARSRRIPVVFTYHTPTVTCCRGTMLEWGSRVCDGEMRVKLSMAVRLPASGLRLCREIRLRKGECAVYVEETLTNERAQDHFFHWTQHVTLGLPLLQVSESVITLPGTRAITWPHGYEGVSLLRDDKEFTWPEAPAIGGGKVNLAHPFSEDGKGFVAGVLLDLQRELGFVSALNWRLGLLLGYCFRRTDFPWVAIWEENVARQGSPWNGKTRARGLEFGTTPMPVGKEETFLRGTLFDMPTFRRIPARSKLRVPYVAFLTKVSSSWRSIRDIQVEREDHCDGRARRAIATTSHRAQEVGFGIANDIGIAMINDICAETRLAASHAARYRFDWELERTWIKPVRAF